MGHQLDDFFKGKLNEREFEFKDAYWADAVELIEAEEDKDRRGFLYWLLAGLVLFSLLGFFGYQQWTSTSTSIADSDAPISVTTPTNNNTSNTIDSPKSNDQNEITVSSNNSNNTPNTNTTINTTDVSKKETSKPNFETTAPTSTRVASTVSTKTVNKTTVPPVVFLQKEEESTVSNNTASRNQDTPVSETVVEPVTTPSKDISSTSLEQAQPTQTLPNSSDLLDNPSALTAADLDKVFKPSPFSAETISNPLSLGLRASSLLYLALPDGRIGYSFGLTGGYALNKNWSLHTDLLYHVRRHQFNAIDQNEIIDYGFGRTEGNQILRASALHSFELPIYASYNFGLSKSAGITPYNKHSLEMGVAPIYLYGTKGAIAQNDTNGDEQILQEGWIETEAYRKMYVNGLIGYNYHLKKYFSVGIRARYAIGGIIDTSFEIPAGVEKSQPDNLYFDINAKFDLF